MNELELKAKSLRAWIKEKKKKRYQRLLDETKASENIITDPKKGKAHVEKT